MSATVTFSAEHALSDGVVEITFPTGFTLTSATLSSSTTGTIGNTSGQMIPVAGVTYTAGTNVAITFDAVENPTTAGGYGPFGIVTRASTQGQIVDANAVFACVGIAGAYSTGNSFTIAYDTATATGVVLLASQNVDFTFTISKDLWKYDMFVITMNDKFVVESSVACESVATSTSASYVNYYNSSISADGLTGNHVLDCAVTASVSNLVTGSTDMTPSNDAQEVYVYGNAFDIDGDGSSQTDAKTIKLRISAIRNPWAVYSALSFGMKTMRF